MLRYRLARWIQDRSGNVLMLTGVGLFLLIGVTGVGVDLGRQQLVHLKLQQATDAVAIAIAGMPSDATPDEKQAAAQRYFTLNYPTTYLNLPRPAVQYDEDGGTINVRAQIDVESVFIGVIGVPTMHAEGLTRVAANTSSNSSDYDVVMVVDESGSTGALSPDGGGTRMDVEKAALTDMVNAIVSGDNPNVRFGMVGYTGNIALAKGLTSDRNEALSYVNELTFLCQNYDHYGMQAGQNMLLGNWTNFDPPVTACNQTSWAAAHWVYNFAVEQNTSVPGPSTNRDDGERLSNVKHLVFLTDGFIMVEPPPCDTVPYGEGGCPNYDVFLESCDALKAEGVIVHTISFVSQTPGDEATLRSCASTDADGNPRYFYAPDGETLRSILRNISTQIKKIRIVD